MFERGTLTEYFSLSTPAAPIFEKDFELILRRVDQNGAQNGFAGSVVDAILFFGNSIGDSNSAG